MRVEGRGPGVAIVRDARGRYTGRVLKVGTGWQAWSCEGDAPHRFRGWSPLRRGAVELLAA